VPDRIIFYFPYRGMGGVSVLFVRLAEALSTDHEVYLVDYRDGYMGQRVPRGVHFIDIEGTEAFPDQALLVVQSMKAWNLAAIDRVAPETRVLFWTLHPYNLYPFLFSDFSGSRGRRMVGRLLKPLSLSRVARLRRLVTYLVEHRALVFMDAENRGKTASFFPGISIPERYIPVLSAAPTQRQMGAVRQPLRCAWVGRIVDFKVTILAHLIERLDAATDALGGIDLAIVGDGDHVEWLRAHAARFRRVRVSFVPAVPLERLETYLVENVDLLFAMGASALEGASRGIPTILLDYSFRPVAGLYRFRFMHDRAGYTLGESISPIHLEECSSLESLLQSLRLNHAAIAQQSYECWAAKFSPGGVARQFARLAAESTATVGEMRAAELFTADRVSLALRRARQALLSAPANAGFRNL
jgi:hypothetical protein